MNPYGPSINPYSFLMAFPIPMVRSPMASMASDHGHGLLQGYGSAVAQQPRGSPGAPKAARRAGAGLERRHAALRGGAT